MFVYSFYLGEISGTFPHVSVVRFWVPEYTQCKRDPTGKERQCVVKERGKKIAVVISIEEYEKILEELEDRDAICDYEEAKALDETPVPLDEAIARIERNRK